MSSLNPCCFCPSLPWIRVEDKYGFILKTISANMMVVTGTGTLRGVADHIGVLSEKIFV